MTHDPLKAVLQKKKKAVPTSCHSRSHASRLLPTPKDAPQWLLITRASSPLSKQHVRPEYNSPPSQRQAVGTWRPRGQHPSRGAKTTSLPGPCVRCPESWRKAAGKPGTRRGILDKESKDPAAGRERRSVSSDSLRQPPFVGQQPAIPGSVQ